MRVVLIGATDLTVTAAEAVLEAGQEVAGVVTAPADFSISYATNPVRNTRHADLAGWSAARRIPCVETTVAGDIEAFAGDVAGELGIVAGWFHMVPGRVRERFRLGCIGFHASLLPELRGGAPLSWAILAGLDRTGISMFELGDGVDDGPLYGQVEIPIGPATAVGELVAATHGAVRDLLARWLPGIAAGDVRPTPQAGVPTYGLQRRPEDGLVDWSRPAADIDRLVRATGRPYPGAFTFFEGRRVRVWAAAPAEVTVHGSPGQLLRIGDDVLAVTGDGTLALREVTDDDGEDVLPALRRSSHRRFGAPVPPDR